MKEDFTRNYRHVLKDFKEYKESTPIETEISGSTWCSFGYGHKIKASFKDRNGQIVHSQTTGLNWGDKCKSRKEMEQEAVAAVRPYYDDFFKNIEYQLFQTTNVTVFYSELEMLNPSSCSN